MTPAQFKRVIKTFTSTENSRPGLQFAKVENGVLWAATGTVAIRTHTDKPDGFISRSTGEYSDKTLYFPDAERLFDGTRQLETVSTIHLNKSQIEFLGSEIDALSSYVKKLKDVTVKLESVDGELVIKRDRTPAEYTLPTRIAFSGLEEIHFNPIKLNAIFKTAIDLKFSELTLEFKGKYHPLLATSGDIEMIVTPMRVY